ncbi:MAG: DUF2092 domain-containing protein [Planctomycetota bacterium]
MLKGKTNRGVAFLATIAVAVGGLSLTIRAEEVKKPQGLPEAAELLNKVEAAFKNLKAVRYSFQRQGINADEGKVAKIEGTVILSGWAFRNVQKFRAELKVQRPGADKTTEFSAGSDGELVFLIDPDKKTVFADLDPAVMGAQTRIVMAGLMSQFVRPDPFEDEKKAKKSEVRGIVKVGEEDCYEVAFMEEEDKSGTVWFFSAKDYLPRRMDLLFPAREGGGLGGRRMVLTSLTPNPTSTSDPFALVVPEGFKRTDEFAP